MSDYGRIDGRELDRHITGNYGEDQFRHVEAEAWLDVALDELENAATAEEAGHAREEIKAAVREKWIAEGQSWITPYPLDLFPEVEWDTLDENGRDQAQRNAAGMARHIGKRICERADALMSEPAEDDGTDSGA